MKIYLIAGEQSGDNHAAEVIQQLLKIKPNIQLRGVGGQQLANLGQQQTFTTKQMELIGITQVVLSVASIYYMMHAIIKDMDEFKPDLIILVDYPGFNLRLAKRIRQQAKYINNTTIMYYIPPKIWLWGYRRVFDIKQYVDKVFCIYPHEQNILRNEGINATYAGNPASSMIAHENTERSQIVNEIRFHSPKQKQRFNNNTKILGWFPGSRKKEITNNYKQILQALKHMDEKYIIIAALPINIDANEFHKLINTNEINTIYNKTQQLINITHIAWAASGTVTLELAMNHVPTILYYHIPQPSLAIGKRITGIKRIGIVNIILDQNIMPELINSQLNTPNLTEYSKSLEQNRQQIQIQLRKVETLLGRHKPATTVAQWIANQHET